MTLLYNIAMLAVDVVAILLLRRYHRLFPWACIVGCAGLAAAAIGFGLGMRFENHFGVIRLWCYGMFLHGTILLAASAVIWRRRRWLASLAVLAMLGLWAVAIDAFLIEPQWLDVTHRRIVSRKIHKPLRIVFLADLQTDEIGPFERDVFQRVLDEQPDLLLFGGDYLQSPWEQQESLRKKVQQILASWTPRDKSWKNAFAVRGNCDPNDWYKVFEGSGLDVTIINTTETFDLGGIQLTCLGVGDSFNPFTVIGNERPDQFHLVLGHAPNYALGKVDADLLLSGHTHGGQIQLPWIGPLMTLSKVPRAWGSGVTELPGGGKLLVSRSIGMERGYAPYLRFLCQPELTVIDLVPEETNADERE